MPYFKAMWRIVLPQSLGYVLPSITNQMIGVIKDSAALSVITVPELSMAAQIVLGESFSPVETYLMVTLLYWGPDGARCRRHDVPGAARRDQSFATSRGRALGPW